MKETLIFIPGFASNEAAWGYQAKQLKENFDTRILVMDRFSTRQEMIDHLLKFAPDRFILVGHSMGGWVAQGAAAQAGEKVSKLILLNTWANLSPQMIAMQELISQMLTQGKMMEVMQQYLPMLVHPSRLQDPKLMELLQSMVGSFSVEALVRQIGAMIGDPSSLNCHPLIQARALIVYSDQDALFPKEHEILAFRIKNSELRKIEECGHSSIVEKPEETTFLIRSFIEKDK